jgi:transcriptional regulator with XRE-family HTH domain
MTQTELAQQAQVSLMTIQRIEAGTIPKGFTLNSIAKALHITQENLLESRKEQLDVRRVKMINLSVLSFFVLPFGNVILPLILTYRSENEQVRVLGYKIITVQIAWTAVTSLLMILSPLLQNSISLRIPLFLIFLVPLMGWNVYLTFKNSQTLTSTSSLYIQLKNSVL